MTSRPFQLGPESRWIAGVALIVAIASVAAFVAGGIVGVPVAQIYWDYVLVIFEMARWALLLLAVPLTLSAVFGGVNPHFARKSLFAGKTGTFDGAVGTLGPIILMPVLMGAYGTLKQLMPLLAPFTWDATFAEAGRLMFFGYRPWQVTHALFGSPLDTSIISFIYALWLPLLFIAVPAFSILAPPYLRARFFVTFAASWLLLGIVAAFLLSSAGPCYAALIGASDARGFAPLMARLHAMNSAGGTMGALAWQQELWQAEAKHQYGFGLGISAMPSMHNATAFLYALCAARSRWWIKSAAYLFAAMILIGSVHLGWHYLADGLVAWAGVAAIWWGAAAYLRWCGYAPPEPGAGPDKVMDFASPIAAPRESVSV